MRDCYPNDELLSLATQLLDGKLEDAQYDRLCELVASDTAAAEWLAEWMEQHAMLEADLRTLSHSTLPPRPLLAPTSGIETCGDGLGCDLTSETASHTLPDLRGGGKAIWWGGLSLLAASLMVVVGYSWGWNAGSEATRVAAEGNEPGTPSISSPPSVATVAGGVDAHFDQGIALGSRLVPGRLRLHRGMAQIAFDRGATVVLQGPAELNIVDGETCQLISGSLSADVLPEATGFSIAAGGVRIADRDTRFGLKTSPESSTEVHAFGGGLNLIDYRHPLDQRRRLAAGEALRWQAEDVVGMASDPSAFVTTDKFREAQRIQEQRSYERWLAYSQCWMGDPSVLLRYEFSGLVADSIPDTANANKHPAVSQQQPRMVGGRWSVKPAMLFDGRTDKLSTPDSPELRLEGDITLAVWLRTRSYPLHCWTRVVGKGSGCDRNYGLWMDRNGDMLWQVCPDEDPVDQQQWDDYSLRSTPVPIGQWVLAVGVVEQGQMKFYIDGELVNSAPAPAQFALSDAPLTIGYYGDAPNHNQYFCGELDEIILLNRALSAEEIKELYEAGNPAAISEDVDLPVDLPTQASLSSWEA